MRRFLSKAFILLLLLVGSNKVDAQNYWALATMENGQEKPIIVEYHSLNEKGAHGVEYMRIYDDGFRFRKDPYNPVKTQFGYRMQDKKIFIYDYNKNEERLAFDFTLNAGDSFTTYNGMEWVVEEAKDTFIHIQPTETCEINEYRLLKVRSADGQRRDQWLENFGSFTYHFMITNLNDITCSQTLWMEYDMGDYIALDINADPLYAHDSGWLEADYEDLEDNTFTTCHLWNGNIELETAQWWYAHREYNVFYRKGDDIYHLYGWVFEPQIEGSTQGMCHDKFSFARLPNPESGSYTIHVGDNAYTTNIKGIADNPIQATDIYDLMGHKLFSKPTSGIYIQQGRKIFVK